MRLFPQQSAAQDILSHSLNAIAAQTGIQASQAATVGIFLGSSFRWNDDTLTSVVSCKFVGPSRLTV
jgi:hypothetical protein